MKEHRFYFGRKFYQRPDGYWVCTHGKEKLMTAQRWVWLNHYSYITPGMEIHHIDEDKSNNDVSNLMMVAKPEHMKIHWRTRKYDPRQLLLAI